MHPTITAGFLIDQGFTSTFVERFWSKVNKDGPIQSHCPHLGPCWEWTGYRLRGYGRIGKNAHDVIYTNRASWLIHFGLIPDGFWVLHKCDNPPCVRPDHLFLGTHLDNMRDMVNKGRQQRHERNGHTHLTMEDVRQIRADYIPWVVSINMLAERHNLTYTAVWKIIHHDTWRV